MARWCLIPAEAQKFKQALKDGTIDPVELAAMNSQQRREFFSKIVSEENAKEINGLFEAKLLLKDQQRGLITWAKQVTGITPQAKRDIISRIEKMEAILDPEKGKQFLEDLARQRLGIGVTESEARNIAKMSQSISEAKSRANKDFIFNSEEERLDYGSKLVKLENYIKVLKDESARLSFREQPLQVILNAIGQAPGTLKSLVASMDNSLWGRQGIKTLMDLRTSKIWVKNFLKSWSDLVRQATARGKWYTAGEDIVIDSIKADIYSRPNALNGKYQAGGYGLDVLSEETYPSSVPEKIPLLGRLFKASESAYNGGALRLRADLADRLIKLAENNGVNTLKGDEAKALGHLISSITGRGSLGKAEVLAREINVVAFSIKFLKSNFDIAFAHRGILGIGADEKVMSSRFARRESAKSLFNIIATTATILALVKAFDPDAVDEDPRSTNFGKIKIFGHWTDITGGLASIYTLASRLVPSYHEGEWGFWYKSGTGTYTKLSTGKYGGLTAFDVLVSFLEGKLSPTLGVARDIWKGEMFGGLPVTLLGELERITTPISIQNYRDLVKDPSSSFILGSMILDALGFSTSTSPQPNSQTNIIPTNLELDNSSFIDTVILYAKAYKVDPETAFNRMFTGQKIRKITNDTIIVERMNVDESQEIKKEYGAKNPEMKLDHTIPLGLGGSNSRDNLKLVTTSQHSGYTKIENILIKALKAGKINKADAQKLIVDFKEGKVKAEEIEKKYK